MSLSTLKNSFDRFGDDLTDELLCYLSFEEKFNFECVSKQFQRCIFRKQRQLYFYPKFVDKFKTKTVGQNPTEDLKSEDLKFEEESGKRLETIVRKCQFIRSIKLHVWNSTQAIDVKLLNLITNSPEYMPYLSEVDFVSHLMCHKIYTKFFQTFGHKLTKMNASVIRFLRFCPNITNIRVERVSDLFDGNQLLVKNLRVVSFFNVFRINDLPEFRVFVDNNQNIRRLKLNWVSSDVNLFEPLLKLNQIKDLELTFENMNDVISDCLKQLVLKSINLKRFVFKSHKTSTKYQFQIFNAIKQLTKIQTIYLKFCRNDGPFQLMDELSSKTLVNWGNVTHLALCLAQMSDSLFEDIDKYLPKLKYLDISDKNGNITANIINCLTKLRNLESFKMNTKDSSIIFETDLVPLISQCPKLELIQITSQKWERIYTEEHILFIKQNIVQ